MESPVVVCEECGFETKTVPKSKKCSKCECKEFIYFKEGEKERTLDFRPQVDIDRANAPTPYNHYDLADIES